MFNKLICWLKGHKRGTRISPMVVGLGNGVTYPATLDGSDGLKVFKCPRCGATWTRKVKA